MWEILNSFEQQSDVTFIQLFCTLQIADSYILSFYPHSAPERCPVGSHILQTMTWGCRALKSPGQSAGDLMLEPRLLATHFPMGILAFRALSRPAAF